MSSWTDFKSSTLKYINSMGGVEVRIQRKAPPILGRAQLAANISLLKVLGNTYSLENQSFSQVCQLWPTVCNMQMVSCSFQGLKQLRGFSQAWRSNAFTKDILCIVGVSASHWLISSLDRWIRIPMTPDKVGLSLWHIPRIPNYRPKPLFRWLAFSDAQKLDLSGSGIKSMTERAALRRASSLWHGEIKSSAPSPGTLPASNRSQQGKPSWKTTTPWEANQCLVILQAAEHWFLLEIGLCFTF
jgi:hypothetical protein